MQAQALGVGCVDFCEEISAYEKIIKTAKSPAKVT